MKKKFGIRYLILPIIITLILLIPENIVWGGQNFQTVPTIGPTNTTTNAPTGTKIFTATQPIRTQTPLKISTSTAVLNSPVAATVTSTATATAISTAKATQKTLSETADPEKTGSISATEDPSSTQSTSVVVLPMVSNGDSAPAEQTSQDENSPIPAFVFPLVVVLLFVIIYLSTRFSLKKSQDESIQK